MKRSIALGAVVFGVFTLSGWLLSRTGSHLSSDLPPPVASHLPSGQPPAARSPSSTTSVPPTAAVGVTNQFTAPIGRFVPGPVDPARAGIALAAFAGWAAQYVTNRSATAVMQGEALAWRRREAMGQLIQTDPAQALAQAAPYEWRQKMPREITRFFEEQVDGRGDYMVAVGEDFSTALRTVRLGGRTFRAFVYGRRLAEVSRTGIPLHGIALEGNMAVSSEPLRRLTAAEAAALQRNAPHPAGDICSVSGRPAAARGPPVLAESGGGVLCFAGEGLYQLVDRQWTLAEDGGATDTLGGGVNLDWSATATNDAWTHGNKTVLYMRVNFPDDLTEPVSAGDAQASMEGVNSYYTENSYNLASLTATVTPLITLPQVKAYYGADPDWLLTDARSAAFAAGYDTTNYDRDLVAFTPIPGYNWSGLAYVHGKGGWLQTADVGVTAHELGHNYGLWHANFWNTLANDSGSGPGTNLEYGNPYDTMGSGGVAEFNVVHKNILDWLKADAVQTITSNGLYRLYPFDVPGSDRVAGRRYAAALHKDALRNYWLEFRTQYPANPWLENGLLVYWSPWLNSDGGAQLLDTTPGSPNVEDAFSREDAAVVIGRTFNDPAAGVHITPWQRGQTGTDPYIDCQVYLGAFPGSPSPTLAVAVDLTNVPVNTVVHFQATASDPDGSPLAYAWTFDDLTFSTDNRPWTSKSFATPGDHLVRCVVSNLKGGEASANAIVTVGAAGGPQITGQVTDPNGVPLEGVLVGTGDLNAATYIGGYTDSNGRYVLVNMSNPVNLNAFEFGYTFANTANWDDPVAATNNLAGIDFVGSPLPAVSLSVDTNLAPETDDTVHYFTVTCTGNLTQDLTVQFNLSGTATPETDYTLNPDLSTAGVITIPAGTNSVSFAFQAVVDPLVQGPQTVTVTLLDDVNPDNPAYVLAPLAESTLTIVDPDMPALATVTLSTPTPVISENGMDEGQLVFTRNGALQNNLLVDYTVGGTAAAGVNYSPLPGVVLIPAGQSSTTIPLIPIDNGPAGPQVSVNVTLTANAVYNAGSHAAAQILILNDGYTTVTVTPTSDAASQPSTPGTFTVQRNGDLTPALVVNYNVGGTASPGLDYVELSGSVTIPAGSASANITLTPVAGTLLGGNQTVTVVLTNSPNYDVGQPGTATLNLLDGTLPVVSVQTTVDDVSEQGNQFGVFTISRNGASGNLAVYFAVSGTAESGFNYVPLDSPAMIPDGSSSVTVNVIPFQDYVMEDTQTVILTLQSNASYNVGSPAAAQMNILDDGLSSEPGVGFCFASSAFPESESPGIAVVLSITNQVPVSVDYIVIGGTAPASRYSLPQGTLTIPPGAWVGFIPLQIDPDTAVEPAQTVQVVLFNPVNATLAGIKIHTYTILNDNAAAVSVSATVTTASEPGPVDGNFRITRAGPTNASEAVYFQITGTAADPDDYAPLGNSALIPAGSTYVDLPVIPVNNHLLEPTQTVVLTLTSATNGRIVLPNAATVFIVDNITNTPPEVTVTSTNAPYAYTGGGNGQFLFTRTGPTNAALTISFGISGTAANGVNYQTLTNVVTIPAGQSNAVVTVVPLDNHQVEGELTVIVTLLEAATYQTVYPSAATVTVQDNDQRVWIDASEFAAAKPDTAGQFTFSRFGTTNHAVTVWYAIGGTATNGAEYVFITNSIVIPAGNSTTTLTIQPIEDHVVEGPRTVLLTLLTNAGYALGTPTNATVTINDDEPMLTITALTPNVLADSGSNGVFQLTRTGDPRFDFTAYLVVGGTAGYGVDYSAFPTNVYFTCGVMSIDLYFTATNGVALAGDETVTADLVANPAYTILPPSNALITITDPGAGQTPQVAITNPSTPVAFLVGTNDGLVLQGVVLAGGPSSTVTWSEVSGPETLAFANTSTTNTTVTFAGPGVYDLHLMAANGTLQSSADVTVVVAADQLDVTNSLHWPLDEGTGTNVHDISGSGRNGEFSGFPSWTTNGVIAGALVFHGTNDYVHQTSGPNLLNGLNAFTVSLWIKPATTNATCGFVAASDANVSPTFSLSIQATAHCGDDTNVVEAVIPTTQGVVYRDSSSNVLLPGQWQHIALTWTNGAAPQLYLNGHLDQPSAGFVTASGVLTNCPRFMVGRGDTNSPASWNGAVDDVRVYPYALTPQEVATLAGFQVSNHGPVVSAGSNVEVQIGIPVTLTGTVSDDGRPNPPGQVTTEWTYLGTNDVVIPDPAGLANTLAFATPGDYTFQLSANDGQITTFSDVTVTVLEPSEVSIAASMSVAAELGPELGQYTVTRTGATNELTVHLGFSGTASNGVNYVEITNTATIPAGGNSVNIPLTPILDYNIKGDQTATITLLTNLAYTVAGGPASVLIQDSPYGYWSIANFTLEELTIPSLSSAGAVFAGDGLANFVKYAFNLDPRIPAPNPCFQYAFEAGTNDGLDHFTLTYTRLLPPRVVAYAVFVSYDLMTWYTGTNYVQELSSTDDGNGLTETVTAQVVAPVSTSTNLFATIRVWLAQVPMDSP